MSLWSGGGIFSVATSALWFPVSRDQASILVQSSGVAYRVRDHQTALTSQPLESDDTSSWKLERSNSVERCGPYIKHHATTKRFGKSLRRTHRFWIPYQGYVCTTAPDDCRRGRIRSTCLLFAEPPSTGYGDLRALIQSVLLPIWE